MVEVCDFPCQVAGAFGGGLVYGIAAGILATVIMYTRFKNIRPLQIGLAILASIAVCVLMEYALTWMMHLEFGIKFLIDLALCLGVTYYVFKSQRSIT